LQDRNVFQRVAIDKQKISQHSGFNLADIHVHQFAALAGCRDKRFGKREAIDGESSTTADPPVAEPPIETVDPTV
jgi:hypothetical protein